MFLNKMARMLSSKLILLIFMCLEHSIYEAQDVDPQSIAIAPQPNVSTAKPPALPPSNGNKQANAGKTNATGATSGKKTSPPKKVSPKKAAKKPPAKKPQPKKPLPRILAKRIKSTNYSEENERITTRIVGGIFAKPNEFPYQVGVLFNGVLMCGGSIVNANWVLTASHCTEADEDSPKPFSEHPQDVTVIAGEHNLDTVEGHEQLVNVSQIIDHEKYNGDDTSMVNDITLLKLATPLTLNQYVSAIELAAPNRKPETGDVIVAGWGRTKFDGKTSSILRKVTLPVVPLSTCVQRYLSPISKNQLCTGRYGKGGIDSCQGDSGGPLVKKENNKFVQVGIVSYGQGCGDKDYPGVYSSISAYRSWIDPKVKM